MLWVYKVYNIKTKQYISINNQFVFTSIDALAAAIASLFSPTEKERFETIIVHKIALCEIEVINVDKSKILC